MALYSFAGLFVEMEPRYGKLQHNSEKYLYDGSAEPKDVMKVCVSDHYLELRHGEHPYLSDESNEYIWTGASFAYKLLDRNGFVLHSSAVAYDGNAYLFSADSGVGKSTHTGNWQKLFGEDRAVIVNDDKPALREIDGVFYACGTPFSGKGDVSRNVMVPVKALCFIHRSEKNEIRRLDSWEALGILFEQTLRPSAPEYAAKVLEILDSFLEKVPVYSLGVTKDVSSAEFAYAELSK